MRNSFSSLGMAPRDVLLRGSATAYLYQRPLVLIFLGLFSFIIVPTASSSFPSAFSSARHGLGSFKGLVTAPTGSSYDLSDISSYRDDLFVTDVDYVGARRNENNIDNKSFDDSSLTKTNPISSPTPLTSPLAIATTFPASSASLYLSSTPRERVIDYTKHPSDFYGINGHSRRKPTSASTLVSTSLTTVTSPWTSMSSRNSSTTPRGRDFNPFEDPADFYGIIGHSRRRLIPQWFFSLSSPLNVGCDVPSIPSSRKHEPFYDHNIDDPYFNKRTGGPVPG